MSLGRTLSIHRIAIIRSAATIAPLCDHRVARTKIFKAFEIRHKQAKEVHPSSQSMARYSQNRAFSHHSNCNSLSFPVPGRLRIGAGKQDHSTINQRHYESFQSHRSILLSHQCECNIAGSMPNTLFDEQEYPHKQNEVR